MEQNLSPAAVAELTSISIGTLSYWRHIGKGPRCFKLGRRVMYKRADVEAWLEAQYTNNSMGETA